MRVAPFRVWSERGGGSLGKIIIIPQVTDIEKLARPGTFRASVTMLKFMQIYYFH